MLKGARLDRTVREHNPVAIPVISLYLLGFLVPTAGQSSEAERTFWRTVDIFFLRPTEKSFVPASVLCRPSTHGCGACRVLLLEDKIRETFIIAMCSGMRSPDLHLGLSTVWFYEVLL